tara:strand:+ start:11215 stop:12189 length:975 start_codon:yes stop_codon:yes gene_type:complete
MELANEIIRQLGGAGKLKMFTGAKNFIALDNGVSFRIGNRKTNYVKIVLNSMDTYDVTFALLRSGKMVNVREFNGIYNDGLKELFERETGMYLSFEKGGSTYSGGGEIVDWKVRIPFGVKGAGLFDAYSDYYVRAKDEDEAQDKALLEFYQEYDADDYEIQERKIDVIQSGSTYAEGGNVVVYGKTKVINELRRSPLTKKGGNSHISSDGSEWQSFRFDTNKEKNQFISHLNDKDIKFEDKSSTYAKGGGVGLASIKGTREHLGYSAKEWQKLNAEEKTDLRRTTYKDGMRGKSIAKKRATKSRGMSKAKTSTWFTKELSFLNW